jgi:hypothetical protein
VRGEQTKEEDKEERERTPENPGEILAITVASIKTARRGSSSSQP